MRAVGSSLPRVDAADKVTGAADYPGDIDLPGQLWMKIVFAGEPHARIRGVDTREARYSPGVVAVLTAEDVPVNEYGLIMPDQPVLCGVGSTEQARTVRWEADHVALVVAESQAQAEAAAKLVAIDYEPLPVVTDPSASMQRDAPRLHPNPFPYPYGERDVQSNVLLAYRIQHGDVNAGFAEADVIVESTYRTHAQEHAYLQPEAGLAFVRPDGRIEVICGGQWMHEEREQIAHALGWDAERIVVRYPAIGGAFGGREDVSVQIVLALAAENGPARQDRVEPRGEHRRAPQATPLHDLGQVGGDARRAHRRRAGGPDKRCRRLCLHQHEGVGQRRAGLPRPVRHPKRAGRRPHGLHQQLPQRRVPRLRRAAGPFRRRNAGEQAGGNAGHGRGGTAHAQHLARGRGVADAQRAAGGLHRFLVLEAVLHGGWRMTRRGWRAGERRRKAGLATLTCWRPPQSTPGASP